MELNKPKVKLVGTDGNAFSILARVRKVLRKAGHPEEYIDKFTEEATSGDYNHLLQLASIYFTRIHYVFSLYYQSKNTMCHKNML